MLQYNIRLLLNYKISSQLCCYKYRYWLYVSICLHLVSLNVSLSGKMFLKIQLELKYSKSIFQNMLKVHSEIDNCTMLKLWGKVAKNCVFVLSVFIPVLSICCHVYWKSDRIKSLKMSGFFYCNMLLQIFLIYYSWWQFKVFFWQFNISDIKYKLLWTWAAFRDS